MAAREKPEVKVAKITARQAVIGALITASASVVTTLIATLLASHADMKPNYQLVGNRAEALRASWAGTYDQPLGPNGVPVSSSLEFTLEPQDRLIEGTGSLDFPQKDGTRVKLQFRVHGGFLHNRFLRLEYENRDDAAIQFGSVIGELTPDGKTLTGTYIGFGAQTQRIVTGTVNLHK